MAFIRAKKLRGVTYYALVENHRDGGKVRQRVLAPMGRSSKIEDAIFLAECAVRIAERQLATSWNQEWSRFRPETRCRIRARLLKELRLGFDVFVRNRADYQALTPEQKRAAWHKKYPELNKAFYEWQDEQIKAHIKEKHEQTVIQPANKELATAKAHLKALWNFIPEDEHSAVRGAVDAIAADYDRQEREYARRIAAILGGVVPQPRPAEPDVSTTGVVPHQLHTCNSAGTTEEWYGS